MNYHGVSIIIPCYNDGKYIMDAVQSVRNQTYPLTELIVVDDGSTDDVTKAILRELNDSGVMVLHTDHLGPSAARNCGIFAASGRYILPLDADDKIDPLYLEKAIRVLEENDNIGIVYCYAELFGEESGRWELPDYSFQRMLLDNIVFVSAVFYREDWEKIGGFCEEFKHGLEDYDFWLSILEFGRDIFQIPEVLFYYRIKPKSRTTRLKDDYKNMQDAYQLIFDKHKELYRSNYDIVIPALRNAFVEQLYMHNKILKIFRFVNVFKRIPIVRKLIRWILKEV